LPDTIHSDTTGKAAIATKLETARTINGELFDGTASISFSTDAVFEGTTNQYFSLARARAAISGEGAISYDEQSGEISFTGVTKVAGKSGDVSLEPADVSLGNVLNQQQVVNAGGTPSVQQGLLDTRPAPSTAGRLFLSIDTNELFRDSGNAWVLFSPAQTGDVTRAKGTSVLTLANVGTAGEYTKVLVDAKGRVVGGSSPSTLAGLGITDGVAKTGSTMTGDLILNDADIQLVGTATVDGRVPSEDGAIIDKINQGTGFVSRTATDTFATRTITGTSGQITVVNGNGVDGNPTLSLPDRLELPGTNGLVLPSGTSANRDSAPIVGQVRWNSSLLPHGSPEYWNGTMWNKGVVEGDYNITDANVRFVNQNPGQGQYASISEALASITDSSLLNPYVIKVRPGHYYEDEIVMHVGTYVVGDDEYAVHVYPKTATQHLFVMAGSSNLVNLSLHDVGAGYAAVKCWNNAGSVLMHKVGSYDCDTFVWQRADSHNSTIYLEYCDSTGGNNGFKADSANGFSAYANLENHYVYSGDDGNPEFGIFLTGVDTEMNVQAFGMEGTADTGGHAVWIQDGAVLDMKAGSMFGWEGAVEIANVGAAPTGKFLSVDFHDNTEHDINVAHPTAKGSFSGTGDRNKVLSNGSENFAIAFADPINGGFITVGDLYLGRVASTLTNVTDLITETSPMGLISGGEITRGTGTNITIAPGVGYIRNESGDVKRVEFAGGTITLTPGSSPHVYIDINGAIQLSSPEPSTLTNILLARALVGSSSVIFVGDIALHTPSINNTTENYLRSTIGPVFVSGCKVSENVTTPRALTITAGEYWYGTNHRKPNQQTAPTILAGYAQNSAPIIVPIGQVPNDKINSSSVTGLTNMTAGYYAKHGIFISGNGDEVIVLMAYAQAQYATLEEAIAAPLPTPVIDPGGTPIIAGIIVQQGVNSITKIIDLRPRHFTSTAIIAGASSGGTSEHGDLLGLADDDHVQYLLASGTRAMAGSLNMGNNAIINVGNINGISITSHASRHTPNGADPLATAAPTVSLSTSSTNAEGIANSFARSDHTHAVTGLQASSAELSGLSNISGLGVVYRTAAGTYSATDLSVNLANQVTGNLAVSHLNGGTNASASTFLRGDGTWAVTDGVKSVNLTQPAAGITVSGGPVTNTGSITLALANDLAALEGLGSTGFAVRTAADTWATRSIVGTANQIDVANGTGVSGSPTLSISANPVLTGTASVTLPGGTTAQQPPAPINGMMRFNSTNSRVEYYANGWKESAKRDGDTFTGPMAFAAGVELDAHVDIAAIAAPATPATGFRRMYGTTVTGTTYTAIDCIDSTGFVSRLFRDTVTAVYNNTGASIPKGKLVYVTGINGSVLTVALAKANALSTMGVFGMTAEAIPNGASGRVLITGKITGVDTSAFAAGQVVYASEVVAGNLTATKPTHPNIEQVVGNVIVSNAVSGEIFIALGSLNGIDVGTNSASWTIGAAANTSFKFVGLSTAQRTFTMPDVSGTVITSGNLPTINVTGDATGSGTTALALTLANTGVAAGSYNNVTVDTKGRVTAASTVAYLTGNQNIAVTGDVSGNGTTAMTLTLATTGVTAGTYGSATQVPVVVVDTKGRVTSASVVTVTPAYASVTGKPQTVASACVPRTTTALIPFDNTTPLSSEGTLMTSTTVTPVSANSMFVGSLSLSVTTSTANRTVVVTVFRGTTLIATGFATIATGGYMHNISISFTDFPNNGVNPVTYTTRVGASSSTTTYVNQGASATMGGASSAFVLQEIV
jgi:hypothetical protein